MQASSLHKSLLLLSVKGITLTQQLPKFNDPMFQFVPSAVEALHVSSGKLALQCSDSAL